MEPTAPGPSSPGSPDDIIAGGLFWPRVSAAQPLGCPAAGRDGVSIALDCLCWGADPRGHHATNVTLWLVTVLVFRSLMVRLLGSTSAASVATLVLTLSPYLGECVVWVTGRDTLLPALFTMVTLRLLLCERRTLRRVGAPIAALLALFAKESTVVVLPCLAVTAVATQCPHLGWMRRHAWAARTLLPGALLILGYVGVRRLALGEWVGGYHNPPIPWPELLGQRVVQAAALLFPLPTARTGEVLAWWDQPQSSPACASACTVLPRPVAAASASPRSGCWLPMPRTPPCACGATISRTVATSSRQCRACACCSVSSRPAGCRAGGA